MSEVEHASKDAVLFDYVAVRKKSEEVSRSDRFMKTFPAFTRLVNCHLQVRFPEQRFLYNTGRLQTGENQSVSSPQDLRGERKDKTDSLVNYSDTGEILSDCLVRHTWKG